MSKVTKISMFSLALIMPLGVAEAQSASPLTITSGFNQQFIATGSGSSSSSTTAGIDGVNVFYDASYDAAHGNNGGAFPAGQTVVGRDHNTYSFAPAIFNTGLGLSTGNTSGTLDLTPAAVTTLYILGTSGNGHTLVDYTLNFSDSSTYTGSFTFPDWYDPSAVDVLTGYGRLNQSTGAYDSDSGNVFGLSSAAISLPVEDQSLSLDSITLAYDGSNSGSSSAAVLAVSGTAATVVPEPASLTLIAAATGLTMIVLRRRK